MEEENIRIIKALNPKDFTLETVDRKLEILEGRMAVHFYSKYHKNCILLFIIRETVDQEVQTVVYRDESENTKIINSMYNDEKKIIVKEIWDKFFQSHKHDKKMNSIRIRYLLNSK